MPSLVRYPYQYFNNLNPDTKAKLTKSICIYLNNNTEQPLGIGFFMDYKSSKYLISYLHVINFKEEKIYVEILNKKRIKFELKNENIIIIKDLNIIIIEIEKEKENDFLQDVQFLQTELMDISKAYNYLNKNIILSDYDFNTGLKLKTGIILQLNNNEFYSNINTTNIYCSPIVTFDTLKIIGINKYQAPNNNNYNNRCIGINLGNIIKEINKKNNQKLDVNKYINSEDKLTLIYKSNKKTTQIFGYYFVQKNIDNVKILYNNQIYDLVQKFDTTDDILTIHLLNLSSITDASCMLYGCTTLISLSDITKWNTSKIKGMKGLFAWCSSLTSLPDISNWDTSNVNDMSELFSWCTSLKSLPDISKWNTSNVNDMKAMFKCCKSLMFLPDISKWNTNNVENMWEMFNACSSLISLPDISKWNVDNVQNMCCMFCFSYSLNTLPDISKWNTKNVTNMSYMFRGCSSLYSIPDISKWNIKNVTNISYMFSSCMNLYSLPDLTKWNLDNVQNGSQWVEKCVSLLNIPLNFE